MKDMPVDDLRRLEIDAIPDPAFVARSLVTMLEAVGESRRRDATLGGRLRRLLASATGGFGPGTEALRVLRIPIALLLLLALLYSALVIAGALLRTPVITGGNGLAVAAFGGDLMSIDPTDGSRHALLPAGIKVAGVSRSPDGTLVTYWTGAGTRLEVARIDGTDGRQLAASVNVKGARCFDVWSADSARLAAEVLDAGSRRILVVDVASGDARFLTEPGLGAGCPLWSPDGLFVALAYDRPTGVRGVGVVEIDDGSFHDIGGDLDGRAASGTNSWSPDGAWVYFDATSGAGGRIYRSNVDGRFSQPLTNLGLSAFAPALSPDGTKLAFIVERGSTHDLYAARGDGADAHLLLADATNEGWSADGEFILARWAPATGGGGLTILHPDGTERRILVPFETACTLGNCPGSGASWGQPRP